MNMLKRTLAMLLVLCMLFSVMPVAALADDGIQDTAGASEDISADGNYDAALADNEPDADDPNADASKTDESETDEPVVDEPVVDEPVVDEPVVDEPVVDEPVVDEPVVDEPVVDEPVVDEPVVDEPVVDEPVVDEPVVDEPETDESETDELIVSTETVQDETNNDALNAIAEEEIEALANFEPTYVSLSYADTYRILHLDCGRKYFTVDWIKALINEMAAAGFTHLELAFGNDGLRFLLDDMAVGSYSDDQVTAAIKQGNLNYNNTQTKVPYAPSVNELTEAEMDAIITHANNKGIKIIPLLNNPGHMNAIVSAASSLTGSSAGYHGSSSTVDLENTDAVNFVKGLVEKYVAYFDGKGCNEFNFGADEYANDVYSTGSMGFGALTTADKYQLFVNYVNEMAAMIKGYGMVPIAFNDGIYFNQNTGYNFDTQIAVAFWTSGWDGYQSASAFTMARLDHKMINVNGDYYYVLGKGDQWDSNGYTYAANWSNTGFMGSTVSNPMGGMFCIWCDYPGAETETQIAANTRMILRAMAAEMQDKDGTAVSAEVIPGGFNADGTIAVDCNTVTVEDKTTSVKVTGCDLTSVTAVVAEAPAIEGAANVLAWDITPYTADGAFTGSATVKLPVPENWDTSRISGFMVETDGSVKLISGTYDAGYYTFKMEHFSVGGVMLLDADTVYDQLIELNVGESKTVLDNTGNYADSYTGNGLDTSVANVTVTGKTGTAETTVSTTKATALEAGATYIIRVYDSEYALSNKTGSYAWQTETRAFEYNALTADSNHFWTLEASGTGYKLKNANGYLNLGTGNNTAYLNDTGEVFTITNTDKGWTIGNGTVFINALGGLYNYFSAGGWTGDGTRFDFFKVTEASSASTEIVVEGLKAGETTVTVGNTIYKIIVHGTVPITIKYQTENGAVIKTETVNVADNATAYTVSNFTHTDGKYYVVDNTTLDITPATVTEYTVTVTETEEDLTQVASLSIEYWLTNAPVVESQGSNVSSKSVTAVSAYSESGIDVSTIIPSSGRKFDAQSSDPDLVYWHTRLLPLPENEQTDAEGDDETLNGISFTKVRYWNGSWAVYTDAGEWKNITLTEYQLVAYYMNDLRLADEVRVNTADWGKKGNGEFASGYLGSNHVSLAFQIVYEDGTTAPVDTMAASLAPYTYFVDAWGNRGVGTIGINQIGDYQIWKVTAETGEHSTTWTGNYDQIYFNSVHWDGNEMTVWEDAENPVSQYTIQNPANNPNTNGYYDNLRWNEYNESILIRIYIKAEETEDSLKVVYFDEKFGDTLYEYNISVESGKNFTNDIVNFTQFAGNTARIDVSNAYIVNALNKNQYFQTDLTQVPEAVGKYNNGLYSYNGSEIRDDGKTLYLYYTINTETLSPNFVADFGLPLSFPLSKVVGEGKEVTVEDVTVNEKTRYGTLVYNETSKTFTYTPTEVLQNIDVLSINIKFTTETEATLTNVGVTPATTVYYGEKFLNFSNGWTSVGTYANVGEQEAEILGESTHYGYDNAYANNTGASDGTARKSETIGNTATFTFSGTGIQVFANSAEGFGYVSVMVKNKATGAIANVSMVDTDLKGTDGKDTTDGQIGKDLSGLPVVSLVDLTGLPHATYDVTITKVMDSDSVYIDGIRVFGTVDESKYQGEENPNPFKADEEDAPDFYEVRDMVLKAINITAADSTDYEILFDQIYASTIEVGASAVITYANANYGEMNRQDLLDNGPKNELFLFQGDTLTMNVSTDRVIQLGLKAPEGSAAFMLNGENKTLSTTVDMFYKVAEKGGTTHTITVENTGENILSVTLLKICDDPNVTFPALTEENIKNILADAGITETPEQPNYTMVELKGTDVLIDGTVFDYTGEPIEPAITVNVGGTQLVEGKDYSVTYTNNVEPGTATVTIRGIATASETLGYTGEVSIEFTINAPEEPEVPEETTKPSKPGQNKPDKPGQSNKPGQGNKPGQDNKPGQGNKPGQSNKPGENNKPGNNNTGKPSENKNHKKATLKITFVNLAGKKVGTATISKTGAVNQRCVFTPAEIFAQAPARRHVMWFFPVVVTYGNTANIVVTVI